MDGDSELHPLVFVIAKAWKRALEAFGLALWVALWGSRAAPECGFVHYVPPGNSQRNRSQGAMQ